MSVIEQTPQPERGRPNRRLVFRLALIVFGALRLAHRVSSVELVGRSFEEPDAVRAKER